MPSRVAPRRCLAVALLFGIMVATAEGLSASRYHLSNRTVAGSLVQTTCAYHDHTESDDKKYSKLVHCRGTRTCFAMVIVTSGANGPEVAVQNQGCWKDNAEEDCREGVCLIDKSGIAAGTSKRQFCCCKGSLCNRHLVNQSAYRANSLSPAEGEKINPTAKTMPRGNPLLFRKTVQCAFFHQSDASGDRAGGTVTCRGSGKCFSAVVVKIVNSSYRVTVASQGCWQDEHSIQCNPSACLVRNPPSVKDSAESVRPQFCCCYGDLCNKNITHIDQSMWKSDLNFTVLEPISKNAKIRPADRSSIILSTLSSVFIVTVLGFIAVAVWRYARLKKQRQRTAHSKGQLACDDHFMYDTCTHLSVDNLTYGTVIQNGQFSTVCKARLGERDVIVKVFPDHAKELWLNEKDIYTTLSCHPNVAKLLAASEVCNDQVVERTLVLEDCSSGTLMRFLQSHTVGWSELLRLILSLAKGVAFIHGEVDEYLTSERIVVAHRNINSQNIFVKANGMCVLSDFEHALQITNKEECPKQESIGSARYHAPEILAGAVNWHDYESSLKQADIYALSLVFWEMCCRCNDLYRGCSAITLYALPYQQELDRRGLEPSVDAMEAIVVRQLVRPSFPDDFALASAGCKLLIDTIEECWDHEPEARLTALCVVRRLQNIEMASRDGKMIANPTATSTPKNAIAGVEDLYQGGPSLSNSQEALDAHGTCRLQRGGGRGTATSSSPTRSSNSTAQMHCSGVALMPGDKRTPHATSTMLLGRVDGGCWQAGTAKQPSDAISLPGCLSGYHTADTTVGIV